MCKIFSAISNFIGKSIATLFAVLFVITSILVLLLIGFDHTVLNAKTYKRALAESRVFEQFPTLAAEQFSLFKDFLADPCGANPLGCSIDGASPELEACLMEVLGEAAFVEIGSGQRNPTETELQNATPCLEQFRGASLSGSESGSLDESQLSSDQSATGPQMAYLENLSSEQWQALILDLLPSDELREMIEITLDQLIAYLNGETDTAKMPLVKLKARLAGQAGRDLLLFLVNAQPPCTEEQQAQIDSRNFGGEGQQPVLCAASGETIDKQMTELQRQ
ncbi:MAG TPA: hypothetical protein VJ521_09195, partial [Acidobacteriota bacterium]|nr:hypothetical protein [Acidobacteriota bacterium]